MTIARVVPEAVDTVTDFDSAEASSESSEPRELFAIQLNPPTGQAWYHASAARDISYNGQLYTAISTDRDAASIVMPHTAETALVVVLPIDHALVRRYLQQGIPPKHVSVTVYRQEPGFTEQIWAGDVSSMSCEGSVAKLRVPSRAGEWMLRTVPSAQISVQCPHVLYSTLCGVSRTGSHGGLAFKVTTTVISVQGRDVRVDLGSTDRNGTWAEGGEVLHVTTQERQTIAAQTDLNPGVSAVAELSMAVQIPDLKVGDAVEIYAGCSHLINDAEGCTPKFDNRHNFGGQPALQNIDLFIPGSYGPRLVT